MNKAQLLKTTAIGLVGSFLTACSIAVKAPALLENDPKIRAACPQLDNVQLVTKKGEYNPAPKRTFKLEIIPHEPSVNFYVSLESIEKASSKENIFVWIDSPGGSVKTTRELSTAFKKSDAQITTYGTGEIMSGATIVHSAGTKGKRYIDSQTKIMSHNSHVVKTSSAGAVSIIKEGGRGLSPLEKEKMQRTKNWMTAHYVQHSATGITKDCVSTYLLRNKEDTYLSPEALVKLGLADVINNLKNKTLTTRAAKHTAPAL